MPRKPNNFDFIWALDQVTRVKQYDQELCSIRGVTEKEQEI